MEPVRELCEEVETVSSLCYLEDRVSASGGCSDSKKNWVGEVQGIQRVAELKKVLA